MDLALKKIIKYILYLKKYNRTNQVDFRFILFTYYIMTISRNIKKKINKSKKRRNINLSKKGIRKSSRNKYFKKGGYFLSDMTDDYLLKTILDKILNSSKNSLYFKFDEHTGNKTDGYNFSETYDFLLYNEKYNSIFSYLLTEYKNNRPYTQEFKKTSGELIDSIPGMMPYHINIGALMFLSFIIELEIFTLFHSIIPYNTLSHQDRNTLNTCFSHKVSEGICTKTRIYKDEVGNNIMPRFNNFTYNLDNIFNHFMIKLVSNISKHYGRVYDDILKYIVPIEDYRYKRDKFEFIFKDWKNRIEKSMPTVHKRQSTIGAINDIVKNTIDEIEQQDLNYIAESTGFFSYMYLVNPKNRSLSYGSCITYSMFELYIMSRLHTNAQNMVLLIEKEHDQPHRYWKITQKRTGIDTLTHYATRFDLSDGAFTLRSIFAEKGLHELRFNTDKNKILKLFIYIIYDMYVYYMKSALPLSTIEHQTNINKIMFFIRKRINTIEEILQSNDIIQGLNTDEKIKKYIEVLATSDNSILTNIDLDIIFKNPKTTHIIKSLTHSEIWEVLSNAIINSNFELVYYIVSQNMDINKKSILGEKILINILTTDINTIYNKLVVKIIKILLTDTDKYTENIVLIYAQNIGHINMELYKKIKILLNIPDLTYDNLLNYVDNDSIYGDGYVINEIILNHNLIHEINTKRNPKQHSLLYIICKKRNLHVLRVLMKVNQNTNEFLIDVNVKNNGSLSTPLHGLIYGEDPVTNDFNFTFKIPRMIDILIENGAKNIENKNGELPVDNIRTTNSDLIKKIKLSLSKMSV